MTSIPLTKLFIAIGAIIFYCSIGLYGQDSSVETLNFKTNSYKIETKYLTTLDEIGAKCIADTFSFLKIFAYADTKGTKKYNKELSKKRANEVYNYLTKKFNIDTSKIYVAWLGEETEGAYDFHFKAGHIQQRCVDIVINFRKPSE